jgi:penicillin-binding protein 2
MVNAYAAIANGGTLYRPHLVKEILDADGNLVKMIEPEVMGQLNLDPVNVQLIREGLHGVVNWETGTARQFFDVPGVDASGKTGTAEFCDRYPQCLDRDGRVKTSHAWFVSYAPTNNPEIVTIVFVYGGKQGAGVAVQGSEVAVPVTNKILRHYFNIQDETETEDAGEEEGPGELVPETTFTARFLGTDSWRQESASVSGFILDEQGQGVENVTVAIVSNGEVIAQTVSGETGQFDLNNLEAASAATWQLRLPDYPNTASLELEAANGLRYLVEFSVTPTEEPISAIELN